MLVWASWEYLRGDILPDPEFVDMSEYRSKGKSDWYELSKYGGRVTVMAGLFFLLSVNVVYFSSKGMSAFRFAIYYALLLLLALGSAAMFIYIYSTKL